MASIPKVTVVTGAAGALGAAVARHLLIHGGRVAAVDRPETKQQLVELESAHPGAVLAIPLDVTSSDDWRREIARVEGTLGPVDGAVLCAGGWAGGKPFHEGPDDVWQRMITMNLETARVSLAALLPSMVGRGRGSVVVVGTRAVPRPWESAGAAAYAASKSAVVALAQVIAAEVLDKGVRVNAVLPSTIDTPANRASMPNADPSRWVSMDSLSEVIGFLLSDASRDVSGAAVPVYGRV